MKWELFRADCKLCDRMEEMIRKNFPFVTLKVHRASECTDGSCCKLAQSYGIRCVPTLVIDGKIVLEGIVDESELKSKLSLSL
ncbi:MAG: thioredoxin family protein [candidate division WOR-3 bacterium]